MLIPRIFISNHTRFHQLSQNEVCFDPCHGHFRPGWLCFACVIQAPKEGHHVGCAVRSQSKKDLILSNYWIQSMKLGDRFSSFKIIAGMGHVLHLATPKLRDWFQAVSNLVRRAVGMTVLVQGNKRAFLAKAVSYIVQIRCQYGRRQSRMIALRSSS